MEKKIILSSVLILLCVFSPIVGYSNTYTVEGFTVEVLWKVKNDKLIAWGDVEGGDACKRIDLSVSFENRKLHRGANIRASTNKKHEPGDRSIFKGEDDIRTRDGKYDWIIRNIYLDCLKND